MPGDAITLRKAKTPELDRIETLLAANNLPTADVRTNQGTFYVAEDAGELVGIGGLELYHPYGLLRSLVVPETVRSQGYGSLVLDKLESQAQKIGIGSVYLLTTTAEAFFRQHDYREISRESAPSAIKRTREFVDLCPASATLMEKSL